MKMHFIRTKNMMCGYIRLPNGEMVATKTMLKENTPDERMSILAKQIWDLCGYVDNLSQQKGREGKG